MKCVGCVQWTGERTVGPGHNARRSGTDDKLRRLGPIGHVRDERQSQQRVTVEHAIGGAEHAFPILPRIPSQANARRHVVEVTRDALCDAQKVLAGFRHHVQRTELRRELYVIAHTIVQRQVRLHAPGVLDKGASGGVGKSIMRIAHALDEVGRDPRAVRLDRVESGKGRETGRRSSRKYVLGAKVVDAAKVHGEVGTQRQIVAVHAELDIVRAFGNREVVRGLVALLGAIDEREGLASEEGETRNIDCHIASAGATRKAV